MTFDIFRAMAAVVVQVKKSVVAVESTTSAANPEIFSDLHRKNQDQLRTNQDQLRTDQDQHRTDHDEHRTDPDQLRTDPDQLRTDQDQHRTDQDQHRTDQDQLRTDQHQTDEDEESGVGPTGVARPFIDDETEQQVISKKKVKKLFKIITVYLFEQK